MLPWNVEDLVLDEERFSGVVRLFPLPDFVMYPHVMQPLRIFEPQYRELLNEALDSDGLIATAVLASAGGVDEAGRLKIESTACVGKVVAHHRLDDGSYNVMLLGARRIRIVEELESDRSFRKASAEIIHDVYPSSGDQGRRRLQERLSQQFRLALPSDLTPDESTYELLKADLPLGVLADLAAFALPIKAALKSRLLRECDVDLRARLLIRALQCSCEADNSTPLQRGPFPVKFSSN